MKLWTPAGLTVAPDSNKRGLVGFGEVLYDYGTKQSQTVLDGQKGKDTVPTNIGEDGMYAHGYDPQLEDYDNRTAIAGNNVDITTGRTFAEQASEVDFKRKLLEQQHEKAQDKIQKSAKYDFLAKQTANKNSEEFQKADSKLAGEIENILDRQAEQRQYTETQTNKFAGGKMSAFNRLFPTMASATMGLAQLAHWGTNPIQYHSTYAANPYGTRALNELNQLRYNPYPDIQASSDAERRAAYANSQAGGMTGGQRYMGRIGLGIGAMRNAANVYSNAQQQNNNYRTQYANALLHEGNSIASRRQNANQHDWSDYVAAHGAKTRGIEQAGANIVGAINGAFQNEFKYRTWQDTLDMYRQQQQLDREKLEADMKASKARTTTSTTRPIYIGSRFNPAFTYTPLQYSFNVNPFKPIG